ncbi:MAG: hypothetical protein AB1348_04065 [Nitrospirota bacterium]
MTRIVSRRVFWHLRIGINETGSSTTPFSEVINEPITLINKMFIAGNKREEKDV